MGEEKQEFISFFDEMNILKTEKRQRVKTAEAFYKAYSMFFEDIRKDLLSGRYDHEKRDGDYVDDLIAVYIGVIEKEMPEIAYDSSILNKAQQTANYIHNTTKSRIKIAGEHDVEFSSAVMFGTGLKEEQIPYDVEWAIDPNGWRVVEIAINETQYVHNYARHKEKTESQATHTWQTQKDEKVRGTHAAADGQTKPINEPFIVGGYAMMFPGDTLTSNPPGDLTINCRCVEL